MSELVATSESIQELSSRPLDIGNGYPADSCLPNRLVQRAANELFGSSFTAACFHSSPPLAYGDDTVFFRSRLASMLMEHSGRKYVDADHLVVSMCNINVMLVLLTLLPSLLLEFLMH